MKFEIEYYYNAQGMEGNADRRPKEIIEAEDRDHAVFKYMEEHFFQGFTFKRFMAQQKYIREWGLTIKEK